MFDLIRLELAHLCSFLSGTLWARRKPTVVKCLWSKAYHICANLLSVAKHVVMAIGCDKFERGSWHALTRARA